MESTTSPSSALRTMKWKFRSFDETVELAGTESGTFPETAEQDGCVTVDVGGWFVV